MNARAALAASLLSIATAAHAVTIDSAGDAFTVQFDGNIETAASRPPRASS